MRKPEPIALSKPTHYEHPVRTKEIKETFGLYLDTFFDGDVELWLGRKEPYIFYKHIFRQFMMGLFNSPTKVSRTEHLLTGNCVDYSTIIHSLSKDVDGFPIHKVLMERVDDILTNETLQEKVKRKLIEKYKQGWGIDNLSKELYVHPNVLRDIQLEEPVNEKPLQFIFNQL